MTDAIRNALRLAKQGRFPLHQAIARSGYAEGGAPDESSQEAFLQEQLKGSAPQYDPEAGMHTAKEAGLMAAGMVPGSGIAAASGKFPTAEGGYEPSMREDWRAGNYGSAAMKGLGAAGDIVSAVPILGTATGLAMKAPLAAKLAMAAAPMAKVAREAAPAAKAAETVAEAAPAVERVTNPIGMHSAAAEAARGLTQAKGSPQQMLASLKGIKPEELHWSGAQSAFEGKPSITKEELAQHFEQNLPKVQETVYGSPDETKLNEADAAVREAIQAYNEKQSSPRYYAHNPERGYASSFFPTREEAEAHAATLPEAYRPGINIVEQPAKPADVYNIMRRLHAGEFPTNLPFGVEKPALALLDERKALEDAAAESATKYGQYTVPGGKNYREVVMNLPPSKSMSNDEILSYMKEKFPGSRRSDDQLIEAFKNLDTYSEPRGTYQSSHWKDPNVLAHLRMSDRTTPEGQKVLHLEELQSDWGQEGRKKGFAVGKGKLPEGYTVLEIPKRQYEGGPQTGIEYAVFDPTKRQVGLYAPTREEAINSAIGGQYGVPTAPYVASPEGKHTSSWVDLGLKRALQEAAKGGYDKMIWTPGAEQAARYDLSKQVRNIEWNPHGEFEGHKIVSVNPRDGNPIEFRVNPEGKVGALNTESEVTGNEFQGKHLSDIIGKDAAEKILAEKYGDLSGNGLSVGGEGMTGFYDKILPSQLQKLIKKMDPEAKIALASHALEGEEGQILAHALEISPKLREAILKGLPAYAKGGEVDHLEGVKRRGLEAAAQFSDKNRKKRGPGGLLKLGKQLGKLIPASEGFITASGKPGTVMLPGIGRVEARPIQPVEDIANRFVRAQGREPLTQFRPINPEYSQRVGQAYEEMPHDPQHPAVKRAYDAMISSALDQYKAAKDLGYDIRFLKEGQKDPYAKSPALGYADLVNRGRMVMFPTEQGFGSLNQAAQDNPLLQRVGRVGDLPNATANDVFRVVHDLYGHHGPGNPFFRGEGEERAYQLHSQMFPQEALPALASETRGQNSWLNYGPRGEFNRTASGADTIFADQKTGVLPEWATALPPEEGADVNKYIQQQGGKAKGGSVGREVRNALRIAQRPHHAMRLHQTLARHGYATDGAVEGVPDDRAHEFVQGTLNPEPAPIPSMARGYLDAYKADRDDAEAAYREANRDQSFSDPSQFVQHQLNKDEQQLPQMDRDVYNTWKYAVPAAAGRIAAYGVPYAGQALMGYDLANAGKQLASPEFREAVSKGDWRAAAPTVADVAMSATGLPGRGMKGLAVGAGLAGAALEPGSASAGTISDAAKLAKQIMESRAVRAGSEVLAKDPLLSAENRLTGLKTGKPISEMSYEAAKIPDYLEPYKARQFSDLQGSLVTPVPMDLSSAGERIYKIGGVDLTRPFDTSGGGDFPRGPSARGERPAAWAGSIPNAKKFQGKMAAASPEGEPIYGITTTMGITGADSSDMMMKGLTRQIPNLKISKSAAKEIDEVLGKKFKDFPGIHSPGLEDYLMSLPYTQRVKFTQALDTAGANKLGLPNVAETRFAVNEGRLLSQPQLSSGYSITKFDPSKGIMTDNPLPHPNYPGANPGHESGTYFGGLVNPVHAKEIWPEWWGKLHPGARDPRQPQKAIRGIQTQVPVRRVDQELVDKVMQAQEANQRKFGWRKGGAVNQPRARKQAQ